MFRKPAVELGLLGVCLALFALCPMGRIETNAAPPLRLRSKDADKIANDAAAAPEDQTGYFFFAEELDPNWEPQDPKAFREKLKEFEHNYDAMLKDRLRLNSSCHGDGTSLRKIFSQAARETRVGMYVDPRVLEDVGVGIDANVVTINVDDMRWSSILLLVLEPLHLKWELEDEILVVRKVQRSPRLRVTREYPIGDIAWRYEKGSRKFDPNGILNEVWHAVRVADVGYGAVTRRYSYPSFSISEKRDGTVVINLSPPGHEALAASLASFRVLKRSLPDSDGIDFPQLLRVNRWKNGFYPRERLTPETLVLLVASSNVRPSRTSSLSEEWPSIAVFEDGESAMDHVRALPLERLRTGIVVLESGMHIHMKNGGPADAPSLQDVLKTFCRKNDIDLFEQVDDSQLDEKRYRRIVKSTDSIYPDEP